MRMVPSFESASIHDEEGRAFLQNRLAYLGRLGMLFYWTVSLVLLVRPDTAELGLKTGSSAFLGAAVASTFVWLSSRGGRRSVAALRAIDAAGVLLTGASLCFLGAQSLAFVDTSYPMAHHVALVLIARAVIVPSTAARTLQLSLVASSPAILTVLWKAARSGSTLATEGPGFTDVTIQLGFVGAALGLSVLASRITYGLRAEVRAARQVGQYTLEDRIGEGGMGVVYRARHAHLKRPTAVKLLQPGKVGQQTVERFEREVQLTARLTHPNTVAVFDYGRTLDGLFYYAMEYLEGVSLERLVQEHGPQPAARVVHVLRQVAAALVEAHALGLVHRDIKPANVILCERGCVPDVAKVLDFGLVKDLAVPEAAALTQSNVILGTPLYMAPEALTTPQRVGPRTDLYSLGALGYYLVTGAPVFTGSSTVEVLAHHLHTAPVPPSRRLGIALPGALEGLLLACLEKDPDSRPADARALLQRLSECGVAAWTEADARRWWAGHRASAAAPAR